MKQKLNFNQVSEELILNLLYIFYMVSTHDKLLKRLINKYIFYRFDIFFTDVKIEIVIFIRLNFLNNLKIKINNCKKILFTYLCFD